MYFVNYEYKTFANQWRQTGFLVGWGGAPGDADVGMSSFHNLSIGMSQSFGFRPFFLVLGILPTLNFYNKISYIDINGVAGIRFEPKKIPLVVEIGWVPRLYKTHYNGKDFPLYLSFGVNITD